MVVGEDVCIHKVYDMLSPKEKKETDDDVHRLVVKILSSVGSVVVECQAVKL
jgi:hypothetical protein